MNVTQLRSALRGMEGTTAVTLCVDMASDESEPLMLSISEVESSDGCVLRLLNDDEDALADKVHQIDEAIINLEKLSEHRSVIEQMTNDSYSIREQVANISHLHDEIANIKRRVADLMGRPIEQLPDEVNKIRRRLRSMSDLSAQWKTVYDGLGKMNNDMYRCTEIINAVKSIAMEMADETPQREEIPQEIDRDFEEGVIEEEVPSYR